MAKDTSNNPFNQFHFNEHVNAILLIMFLAVSTLLLVKGCNPNMPDEDPGTQSAQSERDIVMNEMVKSDSNSIV